MRSLPEILTQKVLKNYCGLFDGRITQLYPHVTNFALKYLKTFNFSSNRVIIFAHD